MTARSITRRTVLGGAAAVGGAAVLAACSTGDDTADTADAPVDETDDAAADTTEGDATAGEEPLVAVGDVPVGSGVILGVAKVVVTQPTEGDFKGFSSTCTHQGCQVSSVSDDAITCACHNSTFSIEDGSVLGGPATAPLPSVPVAVDGDQVVPA
ncbi:MAG: Rieske (2Fe-2S) protein [Jiangellales bacterium]